MSGEKTPWDIPLIRVAAKKGAYWYHGRGKNWTKPHGIQNSPKTWKKNRWSNMQKDVWVRYLAGWFEPSLFFKVKLMIEHNHNQTNKKANPAPWDNRPRGRRESCQTCIWCHSNSILLGFLWMRQIASVQSSKSSSKNDTRCWSDHVCVASIVNIFKTISYHKMFVAQNSCKPWTWIFGF